MPQEQLRELACQWGLRTVPQHVGMIMDGNGRWATARGLNRSAGHRAGVEALRDIIRSSSDLGVQSLSLYAFSTENWSRSKAEVGVLMELLVTFLYKEIEALHANAVRIHFMGAMDALSHRVRQAIQSALDLTAHNTGLTVNIALNYGGRAELARAARLLAEAVQAGRITAEQIDEDLLAQHLYTAGQPELDLLIRTGGDMRISNFMLYQCAYAELVFTPTYWPDFNADRYREALLEYQRRDRRFGGIP